jgi:uncharacterized protein YdcH (DUF465 family)
MADAQLQHDDVKASLIGQNETFRRLVSEHHALDEHLRHLSSLSYLSREEQYEEVSLKKRKLALKDQIEAIVRGQTSSASPS